MSEDREDRVRKTDRVISRIVELWPFWVLLSGIVIGSINFYNTVKTLADDQKAWKASSEMRRDAVRKELEVINTRLAILETKQLMEKLR